MSFQISILKVLASYPEGRASLEALKNDLNILMTSGHDWGDRMKRLAARVPMMDVFSQRFVLRDPTGWQITNAGRIFLRDLEAPIAEEPEDIKAVAHPAPSPIAPMIPHVHVAPSPVASTAMTEPARTAAVATPPEPAALAVPPKTTPSTPVIDFPQPERLQAPIRLIGCKDRRKARRRRDGVHQRRFG